MKEGEIFGTCGKCGRDEKCIKGFGQKSWMEDLSIDK
jgi:hypothetical protein